MSITDFASCRRTEVFLEVYLEAGVGIEHRWGVF